MSAIHIVPFNDDMATNAVQMLARAFVTNPLHVAAFGRDQLARNERFFRSALAVMKGPRLVALDGHRVVGLIHWVRSPACQFSTLDKIEVMPAMVRGFGVRSALRVGAWLSAWSKEEPKQPHVHLGPIGVDPGYQGNRIGQRLMERYCEELYRSGLAGYLETDRPENVAFYERFGFETTKEIGVIGTRNYFMSRSTTS